MMKTNKSFIHKIVTFLNTISETNDIIASIVYSNKRKTYVDVFLHYYYNNSAPLDTLYVQFDQDNFIERKQYILNWIDKCVDAIKEKECS